jgi:hypothetical protein
MGLFRIDPAGTPEQYKTYQIRAPRDTHYREATCAEVNCEAYLTGWSSLIDTATELGQWQAHYIRFESGRGFTEHHAVYGGTLIEFAFEPGQKCFAEHKVRLEKPSIFLVRDGDFRGNPTRKQRIHTSAESWIDDFATHQARLADQVEKG